MIYVLLFTAYVAFFNCTDNHINVSLNRSISGLRWLWSVKFKSSSLMWLKSFLYLDLRKLVTTGVVTAVTLLAILPFLTEKRVRYLPCQIHPSAHDPCRFNQDNSGQPFREEIIPNIVHFYRTGQDVNYIGFVDAICLLGAFWIINPDKIMIHTEDVLGVTYSFSTSLFGKRLMEVSGFKEILDIQYWPTPKHVFGIEFSNDYRDNHISDVTRLRILRKFGGIFLDNHSFVLRRLGQTRHYEMSLFDDNGNFTNTLIVGHRDSRMLDFWLKSYHQYDPKTPVHHQTDYMRSLFFQKATHYHRFENGVQKGSLSDLTDLSKSNCPDCFVIYLNVPNLESLLQDTKQGFNSEDVINIVKKQMNNIIPNE